MNLQRVRRCEKSAIRTIVSPICAEPVDLLVRPAQEIVQHSELVHHLERGWMDCVAAKVAQKIRVLFEDDHVDTGTGEQQA